MSTTLRLSFVLFLVALSASAAETRNPVGVQPAESPVITAAIAGEAVRFTSTADTVQMRVQVLSGTMVIFDSGWKDGNILDWVAANPEQPLASGSYRCAVMARDLEGRVTEKGGLITTHEGQLSVEPLAGEASVSIATDEPKLTAVTHDGTDSAVVSTAGDLTFRFGNYITGKDSSRMRLTRDGKLGIGTDQPQATLDVNGLIRAGKGIVFDDGTVLTSGSGDAVRRSGLQPQHIDDLTPLGRSPAALPLGRTSRLGKASAAFAPGYQFVVNDTGVSVGTTNPAYRLDVTGTINTSSGYRVGGFDFINSALQQSGSTVIGKSAGLSSTGTSNTFVGTQAGWLNTTGTHNSFVGYQAGASNVTGQYDTFFGTFAGVFTTAGDDTFIGALSGFNNTTAQRNTAVGSGALYTNATSTENTAVGYHALYAATSGSNVAVGASALAGNASGYGNIAIGNGAGAGLTTGDHNIYIDSLAGSSGEYNTIRIGQNSQHSRAFIGGASSATTGGSAVPLLIDSFGQLGTASSSRRYKFGIQEMGDQTDDLMSLRPVTFRYVAHGENAPLQYGLIAEEVAAIYPELVTHDADGSVEAVMYQFLAPMLLNEVQKQQRTISDQQRTIDALTERLDGLARQVEELQRSAPRD